LSAIRTNNTAGTSSNTPRDAGYSATSAPVASDTTAAATVTWFAVTPFAASQFTTGRNIA
jgi:hypothetical protein